MVLTINSKKHGIKEVLIDDEDFEKVNQYKWSISKIKNKFYIARSENRKIVLLHRFIMDAPNGMLVDHIDGNVQNNKKSNLRICTAKQNTKNSVKTKSKTTSFYKGVHFDKERNKYQAQIKVDYKNIHLGRFETEDQAAIAYNIAALKYHGEYANLNNVMATRPR